MQISYSVCSLHAFGNCGIVDKFVFSCRFILPFYFDYEMPFWHCSLPTLLETCSLSLALGLCCQVLVDYHMLQMLVMNLKQTFIIIIYYCLKVFFQQNQRRNESTEGIGQNLSFGCAASHSGWLSRDGAWERELMLVKVQQPCKLLVSDSLGIITGFVQLK